MMGLSSPPVKSATDAASFRREFKRIIEDETVSDGTIKQFLNRTIRAINEATTFPP